MTDTEYIRGALPQLDPLDEAIDRLEDELIAAKAERQEIINAEAQKVAKFQVGYEFDGRHGRYRITAIKGDYYNGDYGEPLVWVRYIGHKLHKKGTVGRTETLYPK